ncbi:MAG TPA: preprotein translocase subunit SecG, partial [Candidatus Aerophobetes bacterium]|nr:preprotein translocase subunit SecG [Candidatus Aerophobetes bacterium]
MMGVLLVIQTIVCVLLIGAILLQVGRGASTGAAFGGGVSTFFGPSGEVS